MRVEETFQILDGVEDYDILLDGSMAGLVETGC